MWFSMINADNYTYQTNHRIKFGRLFGDDARRICAFFDVTRATAHRWITNGEPTNKTALRLLDIAAAGFLPCNDNWNGYMIINGRIVTPSGYDVRPEELDQLCMALGREPSAAKIIGKPRNFKPWRDREPDFVKDFKKSTNV